VRILRVDLRHFRGFDVATILPAQHVVVVGEPGAGRSDLIEGLERVFSPEATRVRLPSELDFYNRDTSLRAEVEVVIGDLRDELEQAFFDHLEVWDRDKQEIVDQLTDPDQIDRTAHDLVLRLCYRAAWDEKQEQGEHWVDYPKTSEPDAARFDRITRADKNLLPFAVIHGAGRALDLGSRSPFRRLVQGAVGDDFVSALGRLEEQIEDHAGQFSATAQMTEALERILEHLRTPLALGKATAADIVHFLPEGGSVSGLLRSLGPAIDLKDGRGVLPLPRQGSTLAAMLGVGQTLATVGVRGIVAADDFGEGLDAETAQHLAATLRSSAAQIWLSTRRPRCVEVFRPSEVVRFAKNSRGGRLVYQGRVPTTKAERLAARHRNMQLLPAITARAVIILEGPHNRAAFTDLAFRLFYEMGTPLPSAHRVTIIDAGSVDGSGGSSAVPRLALAAAELGLRTVAVIDHDGSSDQVRKELEENLRCADAVVRLPAGHAIELALLTGVDEEVIKTTLTDLSKAFGVSLPVDLTTLTGAPLFAAARAFLKQAGGLHGQFVLALPPGVVPPEARLVLQTAIDIAVKAADGALTEKVCVDL